MFISKTKMVLKNIWSTLFNLFSSSFQSYCDLQVSGHKGKLYIVLYIVRLTHHPPHKITKSKLGGGGYALGSLAIFKAVFLTVHWEGEIFGFSFFMLSFSGFMLGFSIIRLGFSNFMIGFACVMIGFFVFMLHLSDFMLVFMLGF